MNMIMITAPSSGGGKTVITMGIIRALKNRNIDVSAFKTGGDFLDTRYLSHASGKRGGNTDIHLLGKQGIRYSLSMNKGELGIIEGAMGYFDGMGNSYENSSFHISELLNINSILVYTPRGEMFTAIPKIKGMVDFSNNRIKGIILNQVKESIYLGLKEKIEEYMGIKVLGFIPKAEELKINSKDLGLIIDVKDKEVNNLIEDIASIVEESIDLDELIKLCHPVDFNEFIYPSRKDIKVAIAYDEAFSFYYNENLNLLENICQVEYFSPLRDESIPQCDFLYLGGGYPHLFKEELYKNSGMIKSIKALVEEGGFLYAEAGGLMYLGDSIDKSPISSIIPAKSFMTDKLERFGYIEIQLKEDCILGKKGELLKAHEFHKSFSSMEGERIFNIKKVKGSGNWECGYKYKNLLAVYPHINFLGNMEAFHYLMNCIEEQKKQVI